jgi:prepilin-type N-terminal cleavage/methylation domain-containing protein
VRAKRGFTLIELLISMGVLAVISVYLLETFTVNNRNYATLDQTIEAQQSMRAIADLIERDVRHTGFMIPEGSAICGIDSTSAPDALYVSDHEAIDPGDDMVSYNGARITGGATNIASGVVNVDSVILEPPSPTRAAYDTDGNGTNDSDFQKDAGVIVADRNNPGRGVACGRISAVDAANDRFTVALVSGTLGALVGTAQLVAIPAVEYRVASDVLLRNSRPLARGVEDLQIAYLFDFDGNNAIASSEIRGASGGTAFTANAQSIEDLRLVRINFVARTRSEDPQFHAGSFQSTENRATVPGNDGFRRRVHISTVMPRNLVNRQEAL